MEINDDPNKKKVLPEDQSTPPFPLKEESPSSEKDPKDVQSDVGDAGKQSTKLTQDDIDRIYNDDEDEPWWNK